MPLLLSSPRAAPTPAASFPVRLARAPPLLQLAVGSAGAQTLEDDWADNLPVVRPLSQDTKRAKLGNVAGVSLSSGASSTALRGVARSPFPVDVYGHNGTRSFGRFLCQGWINGHFSATDGAVMFKNTSELGFLWGVFYFATGKWFFGFDMDTFDDWQLVEDIVTKPPPSSWL